MQNIFNNSSPLASITNGNAMLDALFNNNFQDTAYMQGFKQGQQAARDLLTSIELDSIDVGDEDHQDIRTYSNDYMEYIASEMEYLL